MHGPWRRRCCAVVRAGALSAERLEPVRDGTAPRDCGARRIPRGRRRCPRDTRMKISSPMILRLRRYRLIAVQLILVVVANRAAFLLRFDGHEPAWAVSAWLQMLPWLVGLRAISFAPFRLYQGRWRYTSVYELKA